MFAARRQVALQMQYGGSRYTCQVCGKRSRRFKDFDMTSRSRPGGIVPPGFVRNTICPWCNANLRHRLFWTIVSKSLKDTADERHRRIKVLHVAPEGCLRQQLSNCGHVEYLTAALSRQDVDLNLDLTCLELPDCSLDVLIAIHVLEHIPDDGSAIREIFRVLRGGGWAGLMVPILGTTTHEDPGITSDEDRIKYFGQANHVRAYGMDFQERLQGAGFDVTVISYRQVFGGQAERNFVHDAEGTFFLASKPKTFVNG